MLPGLQRRLFLAARPGARLSRAAAILTVACSALACSANPQPAQEEPPVETSPPPPEAPSPVGFFPLHFESDPGWHRHWLHVESVEFGAVRGRIVIDRGIGPEARLPRPDEAAHLVAFSAPWSGDGALAFEVETGVLDVVSYSFRLRLDLKARTIEGTVRRGPHPEETVTGREEPLPDHAGPGGSGLSPFPGNRPANPTGQPAE